MAQQQLQYLTINEIAERFNISTRTVRRYISRGYLTAHRIGPKMLRIDPAEVARFLGEAA